MQPGMTKGVGMTKGAGKMKRVILSLVFFLVIVHPHLLSASDFFQSEEERLLFEQKFSSYYAQVGRSYEQVIRYYNSRLSSGEVDWIARSIIYYSMLFSRRSASPLDPRLVVAVIAVESRFKPQAVSRKGAMGLGQLMPATAKGLGISRFTFHPVYNIYGTVKTLRGLLDYWSYLGYPNQFYYALASYNAGIGAVKKYGGIPPYKETQNYVVKVTNLYRSLAPDMFGVGSGK